MKKEDEYDNFEEWEADSNFLNEKDWKGLVIYRRRKAENNPDDQYDQFKLGEAYVLNKEYEKAISLYLHYIKNMRMIKIYNTAC